MMEAKGEPQEVEEPELDPQEGDEALLVKGPDYLDFFNINILA